MSAEAPHRVGRPLDLEAARTRAAQAAALGDTLALRVLSALASGAPADELRTTLQVSRTRSAPSLATLESVGIVQTRLRCIHAHG